MKSFPESWYPLCRSADVKPGKIKSVRAFEADWIVFRSLSGKASILRRHCPHAGADLSLGTIQGDCLVCPMHAWRFTLDGRAIHSNRFGKEIIADHLIAEEYMGIVYAFWGKSDPFPFPKRWATEDAFHSHVYLFGFSAPYQLAGVNAFDIQHLGPVHRRKLVAAPEIDVHSPSHISIRYKAEVAGRDLRDRLIRLVGLRGVDIEVHSHGGSLLIFEHRNAGVSAYISMLPQGDHYTRVFLSIVRRRSNQPFANILKRPVQWLENFFFCLFAADDLKVLRNARFVTKNWDPHLDAPLIRWWAHFQSMPTHEVCKQ